MKKKIHAKIVKQGELYVIQFVSPRSGGIAHDASSHDIEELVTLAKKRGFRFALRTRAGGT